MNEKALEIIAEWFTAQGWDVADYLLAPKPRPSVDLRSLANLLEIRGVLATIQLTADQQ
jgi:hypothetical protein